MEPTCIPPTKLWVLAVLPWCWGCIGVPHRCSHHFHSGSGESSSKPDPQPFLPPSWYWSRCQGVFWILSLIQLWHKVSCTLAVAFKINTSDCWHHLLSGWLSFKEQCNPPPPLPSAPRQERIKSGEIISVIKFYSGPGMFYKRKRIRCRETLCFYCCCCCSERTLVVGTIFVTSYRSESLNYTETHKGLQPASRMSQRWRITVSPS